MTRARLPRPWRHAVLVFHLVCGVGWMGMDVALAPLLLTARLTNDGALAASIYSSVGYVVPLTLPVLSVGMTLSGLLLSWGTHWGFVRYWWVTVKLALALVLTALVYVQLVPSLSRIGTVAPDAEAAVVREALGALPTQLVFPPVVSFLALGVATVLAVFKPWGQTPWTRPQRSAAPRS